jgi:two-component system nitrogen regulation response regulator GlnG
MITGHGTTDTAIEAMKMGAFDYLIKPLELEALRELIGRAFEISRLMQVPAVVADQEPVTEGADELVGKCPAMQNVYKDIGRVASQDVTVLISGESGTGKELVARAIYQHSKRADKPFLAINCAAIPETLLESELFGHEKGAFTGAERKRIGKFEQCSGGTIFLDEVGDMTMLTQAKILRLIQEQRFERVGGSETIQTNVRLIAATHGDLREMAESGRFRGDLYYRLGVFTIHLPPLRERGDDIPLLTTHFIRRFSRELNKDVQQISPEVMELLQRHTWPGNVRELQSVLKQALLQATGPVLVPEFLPASLRLRPAVPSETTEAAALPDLHEFIQSRIRDNATDLYAESLNLMERELLTAVLRHTTGNQVQAARILGITRGSLRTKMRTLGLTVSRGLSSDVDPEA